MERIKLTCLITLLIYSKAMAQELTTVPTPLSMMTLSVMEDMYLTMQLDPETMFDLTLQRPNEKAAELMFTSLDLIRGMIKDSTGVEILPANALEGKVRYSKLGLPLVTLKKAAKSSDYQQYVKIDISVTPYRPSTTENSSTSNEGPAGLEVGSSNYSAKFRPEVSIQAKFADSNGKSIGTLKGRYIHEDKVSVTSQDLIVQGWQIPMNQEADVIPYFFFLQKAVEDLINHMN